MTVNCPLLSTELMASTLFGHKKGSFTGALSDVRGKVEEAFREGRSTFLAQRSAQGHPSNAALVALGAAAGDETCLTLLMESATAIGNVLAKLVNFFNPSVIVVGGGLALAGERYLASIREVVYRRSTPLATSDLVVKKSALGEDCGVVGAAVLVLDEILSHRNVLSLVTSRHELASPLTS